VTLRRLSGREASVFACLTDAVVAPRGELPPVRRTDAVPFFDDLLGRIPAPNRAGLRAMLLALEVGPLALGFGARMRQLPVERRVEYLLRLEHSPLDPLLEALAMLAKLAYYGDDGVMHRLGYDADAVVARGRELRLAEGRW
jgi:hypothetical protein